MIVRSTISSCFRIVRSTFFLLITLIAYFLRFAYIAANHSAYIALAKTNDSVSSLSQHGTERKMIVNTADTTKHRTTVDSLDEEFAYLNALNPHVLVVMMATNQSIHGPLA